MDDAVQLLCRSWQQGEHIGDLPAALRPLSRAHGYALQERWEAEVGHPIAGWKIAATSVAGQRHINVSGPLAGPIFAHRVHPDGARISLAGNGMRVAECEIVFTFERALAPRTAPYTRVEVVQALASVGPGIEVPDSRFAQFEKAGEAQLIADCACTNQMLVGRAVKPDARVDRLPTLELLARLGDGRAHRGGGANVLGDPVEALVWLVNELSTLGRTLERGQFVTTGACVPPIPVVPGDTVEADYGWIGHMQVSFA